MRDAGKMEGLPGRESEGEGGEGAERTLVCMLQLTLIHTLANRIIMPGVLANLWLDVIHMYTCMHGVA